MKTDINRLHQVALGNLSGRAYGKTFLQCHNIAGTIEVGKKDKIVSLVSHKKDVNYIMPMLLSVLDEHGLKVENYKKQLNEIKIGNKVVIFITDKEPSKLDGIDANIVFMRHED